MKNKKGAVELSIGMIILIVLAISLLIIGLVVLKNIFPNFFGIYNFKIYKNECYNRTGSYLGYSLYQLQNFSNKENWVYHQGLFQICIPTKDRFVCYDRIEVCNKVEVDEIEYDKNDYFNNVPERYKTFSCPDHYSCKCNYGEMSEPCSHFCKNNLCYLYTTISKKDLTKEFLQNNCECINTCTHNYETEGSIFRYHTTNKCFGEEFSVPAEYYEHGWYCQEYKCFENYFVEVN